ncbi:MAG: EAL domain-containing protein [Clostridia bacterium]|nr:EAL domain-containing protein [Clostridia bacterium]MDY5555248.1 EAL domain-containing protein [Blautia sp.]
MKKEISESRKNTLDKLYNAFRIVSDGSYVYVCDMKYDYSRWTEEAVQYFDLPGEYMYQAGDIWEEHIHPEDRKSYHDSIQAIFAGTDKGHDMQYRAKDRLGRYVVCTCRGTVLWDEDGNPDYFVGSIQNHGELNSVDSLTGFQNQYGLFDHLKVLYSKKARANIMMLGIGHFSTINEMWGYEFGNIVIHKVVKILKTEFRNEGVLYRADGVRFVLLTRTLSIEELEKRYEVLNKLICEKLEVDGYHPNLLVYGSAMEIDTFDISPQAMFSCLNYAYNISKENNGEFHIFRDEIDEHRHNLLELINVVRKSIENDCSGFILFYQPIMDARTQRLRGSEALLRWENPEYGMVPPGKFIPIIENDPAFVRLGEWILQKALEDSKPLLKEYPDFELNVNVAFEQLRRDSFVDMVKRCLKNTGYPPENLCLEITERCKLMDLNRLSGILSELRAMGVSFALDDFGTGYSSINILNQLKCELVKIDKVFVDGITENSKNVKLIRIINNLADIYGSRVCVEGIETDLQSKIIKECGVDSLQGYYFSKPVSLQKFISMFLPQESSVMA